MDDFLVSFPAPCTERWDEMRPVGCNRFCTACSKTIHNLSELTPDQAEALLRKQELCVRAEVRPDGTMLHKSCGSGNQRRIILALGASAGLLTSACETVAPVAPATGIIIGKVDPRSGAKSVKAVADNGRTYKAKVKDDGTYRFKPLPYGSYSLKFVSDCGSWSGDRLVLRQSERSVAEPRETQMCIIVGMAKIEDPMA